MNRYINLNRLEFLVTYQCSSNCRHCAVGNQSSSSGQLDADLAVRVLREVSLKYDLDSVMTFGGEPLLYPDVVCAVHKEAKALNIPARQIITNGYWTGDGDKTLEIARSLASAGVNDVSISVDAFHQEYIPIERVRRSVKALWEAGLRGIKWNPCWLVSEYDTNDYNLKTRAILNELKGFLPIEQGSGNVMEPQGRALDNFRSFFQTASDWSGRSCGEMPYTGKPDDIRSLCVEPNGDIPVCGRLLGNAAETDINKILERYNPYHDPYMKIILEEGIEGLVREARSIGVPLRETGYYSVCDLCRSLRADGLP
ncbi:MAG: radical SAM protein [Candidatus Adiutricales bacterium]